MRNFLAACILCLLPNIFFPQVMWQIKTDGVKTWHYADGDEFSASAVDVNRWKYAADWGAAVIGQSVYFTPGQNIYQSEGQAHFLAKKEDYMGHVWEWEYDPALLKKLNLKVVDEKLPFKYTAGALWSKHKYKYGYFECRFKSNSQKGSWPAFWLYAGNENDEIDWFELKGERFDQVHVDVHCPDGCENHKSGFLNLKKGWGGWIKASRSLEEGYNTISGEWSGDKLVWYLNGEPMCNFEHRYDTAMWLVLNTSVAANDQGGFSPGPDKKTVFPNDFVVDYVRVWSEADTAKHLNSSTFLNTEKTMPASKNPSTAKLQKTLKYIYDKKMLAKELGTISLLPLDEKRYSLTFSGSKFKSVKITVTGGSGDAVKTFDLSDPEYLILDLKDVPTGKYTMNISTLNQNIRHEMIVGKFTR